MISYDVTIDDYHASDHVSASKLSTYERQGPWAYWMRHVRHDRPAPSSEAFDVGRAFEAALCGEPIHEFPPVDIPRTGKGSRTGMSAWRASVQMGGHIPLDDSYAPFFEHGVAHVLANRVARRLIESSRAQPTIRMEWPGLPGVQSRPDWYDDFANVAPDLKTTADLAAFDSQIWRYRYHRQAAMVDVCLGESCAHPLIVVEKAWPYRCEVVWLPDELVNYGAAETREALERLRRHYESGEWPQVVTEERTARVPHEKMIGETAE